MHFPYLVNKDKGKDKDTVIQVTIIHREKCEYNKDTYNSIH